jgi:ketosteroid isomerase-like protein
MLRVLALALLFTPSAAWTQNEPASSPEEAVRQTARRYDAALLSGDTAAVGPFWAEEYTFVNPSGARLTRADRIANLVSGRTALDTVSPQIRDEQIRVYGDVAVHTTTVTLEGRYSGQAQNGDYRGLAVWIKRDGRWQQLASQLTRIATP